MNDPDHLADEAGLLEAALSDAAEEFASGDLDAETFRALTERDTARLDEVRREIAALGAAEVIEDGDLDVEAIGLNRSRRRRRFLGLGLVAVVAGGAIMLVATVVAPRLSGQSSSGSISTSRPQQIRSLLDQAATLVERGKVAEALPVYAHVLSLDPKQPEALAQSGWLTFEAGLVAGNSVVMAKGESQIRAVVKSAPNAYAGHLYLGVVELLRHDDATASLAELATFLDLKPPAKWVAQAQPYLEKAASKAGVSVPTTTP
ncbi:MAG: hypothetical protein WCI12_06680 [Actinomycetes bacterium]